MSDEIAEDLVVALLAVNSWSVERVFELLVPLRESGLTAVQTLSKLSSEDIASRLSRAGYTRGTYMNTLLAERLMSMAEILRSEDTAWLTETAQPGQEDVVNMVLRRIKGVGPVVLKNFWELRRRA